MGKKDLLEKQSLIAEPLDYMWGGGVKDWCGEKRSFRKTYIVVYLPHKEEYILRKTQKGAFV